MKSHWKLLMCAIGALIACGALPGCDDSTRPSSDREAPASPAAVTSITGDGEVILQWYPNGEWDLAGYRIYRNGQREGNYQRIGWAPAGVEGYADRDVLNGTTYWYAVSAVDEAGNESPLSRNEVFDTPRPEGRDVALSAQSVNPNDCAFDFSRYQVTDYNDPDADIAYISDASGRWMFALDVQGQPTTEIQDLGYHRSMDDVSWAPDQGWSPRAAVELIPGHIYVVLTRNDNFAKFRVTALAPDGVVFDWAYQVAQNNRELREGDPVVPVGQAARSTKTRLSVAGGPRGG